MMGMDPVHDHALNGIERLELELVVRDFTSLLNSRCFDELTAFLHPDVEYRPSLRATVRGRSAVIALCEEIHHSFDEWCTSLLNVAVTEDVVLAEQALRLRLPGEQERWIMGFASFRMHGFQISAWHQVHA
ncbi:hypothetical protein GCM10009775_35930 [Microbacterium aoyamense]|uniref:SnoaL-like domain-containing protein n=2 Tax=Microbacterium aoyamense TaxID=344166 RepID=A0ABN2Q1G4_9MICO